MGFFSTLMDLLFPPRCTFCRAVLKKGKTGVCEQCASTLPFTGSACAQKGDFFTQCISPLYYEGDVRESLHRYKFKEATAYAKPYGAIVAGCVKENFDKKYSLISWVPLSDKRLKSRGYDQAMLLAMATALELDNVAVETLVKHTDVPAQSGVGSEEKRRANVSGVYAAVDTELIAGQRILLIDDIITTGSTLSECAMVLLQAGAESVMCATLAKTRD